MDDSGAKAPRKPRYVVVCDILQDLSQTISDLIHLKDQLISGNTPLLEKLKGAEKEQVEPAVESLAAFLDNAPGMIANYREDLINCTIALRENLL